MALWWTYIHSSLIIVLLIKRGISAMVIEIFVAGKERVNEEDEISTLFHLYRIDANTP